MGDDSVTPADIVAARKAIETIGPPLAKAAIEKWVMAVASGLAEARTRALLEQQKHGDVIKFRRRRSK